MRELSLRHRVRWLVIPALGLSVGCALIDPLQDPEYWSDTGLRGTGALWLVFAGALAVPTLVLLAAVRTVVCWAVGVLALTVVALWLPISFALSGSSTRGLAFVVPVIYGLPGALLLAVVDRSLRSPSRGPAPAAR